MINESDAPMDVSDEALREEFQSGLLAPPARVRTAVLSRIREGKRKQAQTRAANKQPEVKEKDHELRRRAFQCAFRLAMQIALVHGNRGLARSLAWVATENAIRELVENPVLMQTPGKAKEFLKGIVELHAPHALKRKTIGFVGRVSERGAAPPAESPPETPEHEKIPVQVGSHVYGGDSAPLKWQVARAQGRVESGPLRAEFEFDAPDTILAKIVVSPKPGMPNWNGRYARVSLWTEPRRTLTLRQYVLLRDIYDPGIYHGAARLKLQDASATELRGQAELVVFQPDDSRATELDRLNAVVLGGPPQSSPELVAWLVSIVSDSGQDRSVRCTAARALGNAGAWNVTDAARDTLAGMLVDSCEEVRLAAAEGIGGLGSAIATEAIFTGLYRLLRGSKAERVAAAYTLAELGWSALGSEYAVDIEKMKASRDDDEHEAALAASWNL